MKLTPIAFLALSIIFVSCQKEINTDISGGSGNGGGSTAGLLIKAVAVTGSDTMTSTYTYDSQKRLESLLMNGTTGGQTLTMRSYKKYERDGAGRVIRILQKIDQNGLPSDTAINIVHYPNATTMEYNYTVNTIGFMGFSTVDSAVYVFTSGKLMTTTSYLSSPLFGSTPISSTKIDFTYDGQNRVSVMKMYSSGTTIGGPLAPIANQTYTYGSSLNMLWMTTNAAQNYLLNGMPVNRNDALVKLQMDDLTGTSPSASFIANISYVMGADNKPLSMTQTITGSQPGVTKTTFYYQ